MKSEEFAAAVPYFVKNNQNNRNNFLERERTGTTSWAQAPIKNNAAEGKVFYLKRPKQQEQLFRKRKNRDNILGAGAHQEQRGRRKGVLFKTTETTGRTF